MLLHCLIASLFTMAGAVLGPDSLYQSLSPLTLFVDSPSGFQYKIEPYTQGTQLGTQNLSCGPFQTYSAANGLYTYHQDSGGSTASGCSPRAIRVTLACNGGSTAVTMGPVSESPACSYHGTLYTPEACGVNFAVGQETASVSGTATTTPTPTASSSTTGTASATGTVTSTLTSSGTVTSTLTASATSTPMYFVTLFPTATPSAPQTPSTTPMFMVTAWPTTSPQNVSPSSTPMYFMTAYPTNDPNNGTLAGGAGLGGGGSTSMILGAVAVAGVAGGGIAYVVKHFRSGGSVKSLIATAIRNRSKIADTLKDMPIPDSVKSKMMNAESLIPDSAKDLIKAAKSPQDLINNLPIPEELKSHLKRKAGNINMEEKLMKMLQDASGVDLKPTLDMAEEGEVEEEVEEVQTVNVTLDEKPVTTIVVDQGIALTSRASKKSVNIVVESEEGTNSVSK